MSTVDRVILLARTRLGAAAVVARAGRAAAIGAGAGAAAALLSRIFYDDSLPAAWAWAPGAALVFAGAVGGVVWAGRPSRLAAASEIDRRLRQRGRLSNAWELAGGTGVGATVDPVFGALTTSMAHGAADATGVRRVTPIRAEWHWGAAAAVVALGVGVAAWMPGLDVLGMARSAAASRAQTQKREDVAQNIREVLALASSTRGVRSGAVDDPDRARRGTPASAGARAADAPAPPTDDPDIDDPRRAMIESRMRELEQIERELAGGANPRAGGGSGSAASNGPAGSPEGAPADGRDGANGENGRAGAPFVAGASSGSPAERTPERAAQDAARAMNEIAQGLEELARDGMREDEALRDALRAMSARPDGSDAAKSPERENGSTPGEGAAARPSDDSPTPDTRESEFTRRLRQGDLAGAQRELEKMQHRATETRPSPEEREQLARDLRDLARDLERRAQEPSRGAPDRTPAEPGAARRSSDAAESGGDAEDRARERAQSLAHDLREAARSLHPGENDGKGERPADKAGDGSERPGGEKSRDGQAGPDASVAERKMPEGTQRPGAGEGRAAQARDSTAPDGKSPREGGTPREDASARESTTPKEGLTPGTGSKAGDGSKAGENRTPEPTKDESVSNENGSAAPSPGAHAQPAPDPAGSTQPGPNPATLDRPGSAGSEPDQRRSDQAKPEDTHSEPKRSDRGGPDQVGSDQVGSDQSGTGDARSDQRPSGQAGADNAKPRTGSGRARSPEGSAKPDVTGAGKPRPESEGRGASDAQSPKEGEAPESLPRDLPSAEAIQRLAERLKDMQKPGQDAQRDQRAAREMRERAQKLW
ncbi:MAG TPA: hypothetical protein PL072_01465, partial [Phycisphaerales bacterium]|nr:hypothetical protein [Phycisphaerales bacterium]